MKRILCFLVIALLSSVVPAPAEFLQIDLSIYGMDWMTCAFAVRGALNKVSPTESVDVSLNRGVATVKLKRGNSATPEQFWEAVKKSGFTTKQMRVIVRGNVSVNGNAQFHATGTNRSYQLSADPKSPEVLDKVKRVAGQVVTIEGTIMLGKEAKRLGAIQVQSVR